MRRWGEGGGGGAGGGGQEKREREGDGRPDTQAILRCNLHVTYLYMTKSSV